MAMDIFSSFDDHNKVLMGWYYFIWLGSFVGIFFSLKSKPIFSLCSGGNLNLIKVVYNELVGRTLVKHMGGSGVIFLSLLLVLSFLNLIGLIPYVFSLTSHLSINFSFSICMWLSIIFLSVSYDLGGFLAHLQPLGAPAFLSPFLCVIELVSLGVRPLTLAVRLAANLSTGHILMGLLGSGFVSAGFVGMFVISLVGIFYSMFELAVCLIQAYIFTLLPTLYADEHPVSS